MGGGDLNLKKSWHPLLMKNQMRRYDEEKQALAERRLIEQVARERAEERQVEYLEKEREEAGGKRRSNRINWMYEGPASGQAGTSEELEGYLLGKRRVDNLVQADKDTAKLKSGAAQESLMASQPANTSRDTAAKVRDDPLLAMKKKEQEGDEVFVSDPSKRRRAMKSKNESEKDDNHHGHRHHGSEQHGNKRKRRNDDEETRDGHRSKRPRHEIHERSERRHGAHHRRTHSSRSRSRSPTRSRHDRNDQNGRQASNRERGRSPYRHEQHRRAQTPSHRGKFSSLSGSQSPPRHLHQEGRHRSRSPISRRVRPPIRSAPPRSYRDSHQQPPSRSGSGPYRNIGGGSYPTKTNGHHINGHIRGNGKQNFDASKKSPTYEAEENARKLAAMQDNAASIERDRQHRVARANEEEEAERAKDNKFRSQHGRFVSGIHRQAEQMDLGETLRRRGMVST